MLVQDLIWRYFEADIDINQHYVILNFKSRDILVARVSKYMLYFYFDRR